MSHPLRVGAILPSGNSLSQLMVAQIQVSFQGYVVELGPGTGSITKALVNHGIPENRLILIESSKEFVSYLRRVYPDATVIHGNAAHLEYHIESIGIRTLEHVVSGIPFVACGEETRKRICEAVLNLLNPGGSFVQVTYFGFCPIPLKIINKYKARRSLLGIAKWNFPPAFVWRIEKPG